MSDILQGDCLQVLQSLPENSVQCCVTSPPYYGLRSYLPDGHEDKPLEIGSEETPQEYVTKLVQVFREVRRVLRNDGTLWLNIGDSYGTGTKAARAKGNRGIGANTQAAQDAVARVGGQAKQLMMIPARVAIALQEDGWYLRSDIIWHKPSAMPESVTDRPTNDYEHVFLLAKSERYYYDADAIAEQAADPRKRRHGGTDEYRNALTGQSRQGGLQNAVTCTSRNKRSVWSISTRSYAQAHFATMPEKLVEPCILAGSRTGDTILDPFMGAGTVALVAIRHHRQYIGIELNPDYIELIHRRIAHVQTTLWTDGGAA